MGDTERVRWWRGEIGGSFIASSLAPFFSFFPPPFSSFSSTPSLVHFDVTGVAFFFCVVLSAGAEPILEGSIDGKYDGPPKRAVAGLDMPGGNATPGGGAIPPVGGAMLTADGTPGTENPGGIPCVGILGIFGFRFELLPHASRRGTPLMDNPPFKL